MNLCSIRDRSNRRPGVDGVPELVACTAQGAGGGHSRTLHSRTPTLQNGRPGVDGVPELVACTAQGA